MAAILPIVIFGSADCVSKVNEPRNIVGGLSFEWVILDYETVFRNPPFDAESAM